MKNGLKILSTRKLNSSVKAAGHLTLFEEDFITIVYPDDDTTKNKIRAVARDALVIFTSVNAVHAVARHSDPLQQWEVFAIAHKTVKTVMLHFPNSSIIASAPHGKELAGKILNMQPRRELVFFCGDKRMDTIPEALRNHGLGIREITVYKTNLRPVKLDTVFDGILFFSPSAAESFFSSNQIPEPTVLFSIGNTTTKALRQFTENKIITSDFPDIDEVIRLANNFNF